MNAARPRPAALAAALAALACAAPRAPAPPAGAPAAPLAGDYGEEPKAPPTDLERAALDAVAARVPGPAPARSASLALAARALAADAAAGAPDPLSLGRMRTALAAALAYDPAPAAYLVEGKPSDLPAMLRRTAEGADPATHGGAGVAVHGARTVAVVLLARRTARVHGFPREVAPGEAVVLRGELVGLDAPTVHVSSPAGESRPVPLRAEGRRFEAPLRFDAPGRWTVEVVGTRPQHGPELAAILTVACGGGVALGEAPAPDERDPADLRAAEERVVAAINALRRAHGLSALAPSAPLAAVARRHSEAMAARGEVAHVLPGSGDVGDRLGRAGIPWAAVAENVARGDGALVAQRALEASPAHRENMLSRTATEVGVGAARGAGGQALVYLTEVFRAPPRAPAWAGGPVTPPDARFRAAAAAQRSRAGAPALTDDPALDALARQAAQEMLRAGAPSGRALEERAFALGRREVAVDVYVGRDPADAAERSSNALRRQFRRMGVGTATGDSARYGAQRLWIAVVYTD